VLGAVENWSDFDSEASYAVQDDDGSGAKTSSRLSFTLPGRLRSGKDLAD